MTPRPYLWTFEQSNWEASTEAATFSVGIFQWVPNASGKGLKRSKAIRVAGYTADPQAVYKRADELCRRLNRERVMSTSPPAWLQKQYSVPKPDLAKLAAHPVHSRLLRKPTAARCVAEMARSVLGPELKQRGFRRRGRVFWRNSPTVCQVISLTMARWSTAAHGSFDVFMGVFWHEIEAALKNPSSGRVPPPQYHCTFRINLGSTTPARMQKSWDVESGSDVSDVGQEVLTDLLSFGIPWLEYRSRLECVLDPYPRACSEQEFLRPSAEALFRLKRDRKAAARKLVMELPRDLRKSVFATKSKTGRAG